MEFQSCRNILLIKPSALGDIVHALPVLPSLRAAFPQAKLTWLVRKEFAPLLECVQGLDKILLFDRKGMSAWYRGGTSLALFRDFWTRLRNGQFDLVLDLQGLLRSAVFARMTGCPDRVGLKEARELAGLFYTRTIDRPADSAHILDYYFAVLKAIGVRQSQDTFRFSVPPKARDSIGQKLQDRRLAPKHFVVLVPGSAHAYKCWPAERFAGVAETLYRQSGWNAVVAGTASEAVYAEAIRRRTATPVVDLTGQTSIPELIALFEQAAAVVSNDTGPGHIALATETPGVVIFGNTNPLRLGPYRRPECVAAVDLEKRGIEIKDTNPAHRIEHVSVEMVMEKINLQLEK